MPPRFRFAANIWWMLLAAILAAVAAPSRSAERPDHLLPLEHLSPVSAQFARDIREASATVPDHIWQIVRDAGWRVGLAESIVGAVPELGGLSPRGWPAGTHWENTDAVHLPESRQIVVAATRRNKKGQIVACTRVGGVLRHELGHALDMIADSGHAFRSATPAFRTAYLADVRRMNDDQRQELDYYLQTSDAGRQEAFAEAFGIVCGGGSDVAREAVFQACFVETLAFLRKLVATGYPPSVPTGPAAQPLSAVGPAPVLDAAPAEPAVSSPIRTAPTHSPPRGSIGRRRR